MLWPHFCTAAAEGSVAARALDAVACKESGTASSASTLRW